MAHTNRGGADLKIRAVLSGGHPLAAQQAAHDVAELVASDIEGALLEWTPGVSKNEIQVLLRSVIKRRFQKLLAPDEPATKLEQHRALPVANLKPLEVITQRKVGVSLASLYRYVDANRFYCVVPSGQSNGREFPAWQFYEPVPELLQPVLIALRGALRNEVHAFLVTGQDALNELAPAEVLAGTGFETRSSLHASQLRILNLPAVERQKRVLALLDSPG